MKRILFLLLLLANLCSAQTTTTTIDLAGAWGNMQDDCPGSPGCFFGEGWRTIGGVSMRATHGCPSVTNRINMTSFVSIENGTHYGGGFILPYNFKSFYKYKITTTGSAVKSILQLQMTNTPTFATDLCTFRSPAVDIISTTKK